MRWEIIALSPSPSSAWALHTPQASGNGVKEPPNLIKPNIPPIFSLKQIGKEWQKKHEMRPAIPLTKG